MLWRGVLQRRVAVVCCSCHRVAAGNCLCAGDPAVAACCACCGTCPPLLLTRSESQQQRPHHASPRRSSAAHHDHCCPRWACRWPSLPWGCLEAEVLTHQNYLPREQALRPLALLLLAYGGTAPLLLLQGFAPQSCLLPLPVQWMSQSLRVPVRRVWRPTSHSYWGAWAGPGGVHLPAS